tara:strand:- start:838 stop:1068 length:231 start_codon:yes stop_codon:yes gene_type:complete
MPYYSLPEIPVGRTKYQGEGCEILLKNHADVIANIILNKWIWLGELVRYKDLPTKKEYVERLIDDIRDIIYKKNLA